MRWKTVLVGIAALAMLMTLGACGSGSDERAATAQPTPTTTEPTSLPESAAPAEEPTVAAEPETVEATTVAEPTAVAEPAAQPVSQEPVVEPVTFNDDFGASIQPILIDRCSSCHNPGGPGTVHWNLGTAQDVADTSQLIAAVTSDGYMAPWPAGELSVAFQDDRGLRDDEIQAIKEWASAGGLLDVPGDTSMINPQGVVALDRVDDSLTPAEPYDGSPAVVDDYRCLVYDPLLTEEQWMAGFNFRPDQTLVVHHAVGTVAPASVRGFADELDAESPGAGWECFGGDDLPNTLEFLAWAPGQGPTQYPESSGLLLEPGDFFVIQIHYHYEVDAPADASALEVQWSRQPVTDEITISDYFAPAEIPCRADESGPLCDRDAAVARALANFGPRGFLGNAINAMCGVTPDEFALTADGIASSSCDSEAEAFGEIVSVFGHEHELGASFRMTLNPDTDGELILLDIPRWDFDWQYDYRPVEAIVLEPGDVIRTECTWDRSLRDAKLEPSYVLWANGTNDEMCFATITTRGPVGAGRDNGPLAGFGPVPRTIANCIESELEGKVEEGAIDPLSEGSFPSRAQIEPLSSALFDCADGTMIGAALAESFLNLLELDVPDNGEECLASELESSEAVISLFQFTLDDASMADAQPMADIAAGCLPFGELLLTSGFPLGSESADCLNENGRDAVALVFASGTDEQVAIAQAVVDELYGRCLTPEELALLDG